MGAMYYEVEKGLREMFPGVDIDVQPRDYECRLATTVTIEGKRFVFMTPEKMDARSLTAPEWMHRFAIEIRTKLP